MTRDDWNPPQSVVDHEIALMDTDIQLERLKRKVAEQQALIDTYRKAQYAARQDRMLAMAILFFVTALFALAVIGRTK